MMGGPIWEGGGQNERERGREIRRRPHAVGATPSPDKFTRKPENFTLASMDRPKPFSFHAKEDRAAERREGKERTCRCNILTASALKGKCKQNKTARPERGRHFSSFRDLDVLLPQYLLGLFLFFLCSVLRKLVLLIPGTRNNVPVHEPNNEARGRQGPGGLGAWGLGLLRAAPPVQDKRGRFASETVT
jgi:hypothetical protein